MFIEPRYYKQQRKGWIEVVCGCMFSGKTEELIRRVKRARIANQKVEIFKPAVDTRYDEVNVISHNENAIPSTPVTNALNILLMTNDADVIGIDEAQFFDDQLIYVCEVLAGQGRRVIVVGLDMDYLGKPFGVMPQLMAVAEYVTKVHAICVICGDLATHSYRKVVNDTLIMLGEKDTYEARCRHCFTIGMRSQ
ncbi:MAG: thymidine kinase [Bacteroidia bacterium]|nr:thymidine kinase [Bacteroidia bacterium]